MVALTKPTLFNSTISCKRKKILSDIKPSANTAAHKDKSEIGYAVVYLVASSWDWIDLAGVGLQSN